MSFLGYKVTKFLSNNPSVMQIICHFMARFCVFLLELLLFEGYYVVFMRIDTFIWRFDENAL